MYKQHAIYVYDRGCFSNTFYVWQRFENKRLEKLVSVHCTASFHCACTKDVEKQTIVEHS